MTWETNFDRKIVMDDGTEIYGYGFGAAVNKTVEVVFNTSVVGYQEILSDPSYTDQAVVMTYPLIGNYGMAKDDYETKTPTIGALIVREYTPIPSNFRCANTLEEIMKQYDIPGISGVDTRMLTRWIRNQGSRRACIADASMPTDQCLALLTSTPIPHDAVSRVSHQSIRQSFVPDGKFHVVAVDCGMKENILRCLNQRKCNVTIVPWNCSAETVRKLRPDGIFLSNGPGDPVDAAPVISLVQELKGSVPIFGICLGHQILSLAYGAKTYKLKFGHRGGNHPVRNLQTGKIEITSQNHSYAVDAASLESTPLQITHRNILDGTVEGVACPQDQAFSVQYHPESAPGPQDSAYLFDRFLALMEEHRNAKTN